MNLAEGSGRGTDRDCARFVSNAIGSANELDYQLLLASDLGYLEPRGAGGVEARTKEVRMMLVSLRETLINNRGSSEAGS